MSVFLLNLSVCCFVFFYSGNSSTYFKVLCQSLHRKSDRARCLAVSFHEYNLGPKITSKSAERAKAFGFLKEERNSVVNIGD